jgi:hypothetical protein
MSDLGHSGRVKSLIQNFRNTNDINTRNETLKQLKLMILHFSTLPPYKGKLDESEFFLAREIYELEMEQAITKRNEKEFDLAYLKIKQFYFDYK